MPFRCNCCDNYSGGQSHDTNNGTVCVDCFEGGYTICSHCGSVPHVDDTTTVSGRVLCDPCTRQQVANCADCGCQIDKQMDPYNVDGYTIRCRSCHDMQNIECTNCGNSIDAGDSYTTPSGDEVCESCYDEICTTCEDCGRVLWHDCQRYNDLPYCNDCAPTGEWAHDGFFVENPTYDKVGSTRKFGMEFETSKCDGHHDLEGRTVFGCKEDGSVDGMEFVSPVLYGDEGLDAITDLCRMMREKDFEIDSSCGLHLHLDCSRESEENLKKIALAYHFTYDFWTSFVSNARKANYYCAKHRYDANDLRVYDNFRSFLRHCVGGTRYDWLNLNAYTQHNTVEIRFHSATLNGTKATNWVKAHARFIDAIVEMSMAEITRKFGGRETYEQFEVIKGMWDDTDLADFYAARAESFNKSVTTDEVVTV